MRRLFHSVLGKKTKGKFQTAELREETAALKNPARGWYQIYSFFAEEAPDLKGLSYCLSQEETLALVIIDIGAYREEKIPADALGHIRSVLGFFKEKQYDMILRIVYDHEGNAMEREPFFFGQVMEHIGQLMPLIQEYAEQIFVLQGMFVGNWGEMHTSRFLETEKLKKIWELYQAQLKEMVYFAVRKPVYWRMLHPKYEENVYRMHDGMGLFDDAIFGSKSHLGTFGTEKKEIAGWEGMWQPQEELEFEERLCQYVPNGGEVIFDETYEGNADTKEVVDTLKKMHITYLNRAYDERILTTWKKQYVKDAGIWQNESVYDYIGKHLGYRFLIESVTSLRPGKKENKMGLTLVISIKNVGFAPIYQETELILEWGQNVRVLDFDMRGLGSGDTQKIFTKIETEECRCYLSARRKSDGRGIYFANAAKEDGRVFLGEIREV